MKGMIFAAGLGTRLRPLTDHLPKALIEVGGVPQIDRVIARMREAGIDDITVNVHHHADMLEKHIRDNYGDVINISDERDALLDTGGALVKALPFLKGDEPILLYNADIFSNFPIEEMAAAHTASGAAATLLTSSRQTSRYLLFDADGRMRGWRNMSTGEERSPRPLAGNETPLAFGGIHIIEPRLIERMAREHGQTKFSITPFYIESCAEEDYRAFQPSDHYDWVDIGRPETLAIARELAK